MAKKEGEKGEKKNEICVSPEIFVKGRIN